MTVTTPPQPHQSEPRTPTATADSHGDEKPITMTPSGGSSGASTPIQAEALPDRQAAAAAAPAAAAAKPPAPEETRTRLQTTLIKLSLCSALFLAALDVTSVTVAAPTISEQFHSTVGYTWIGSAYLLANAASAPSWGKISDIWGRKQILLCAVAVFWVGSLLSATSVSMGMLIAARAVQGCGGGGIVILVNVCISDLFSMRKRGWCLFPPPSPFFFYYPQKKTKKTNSSGPVR